MTHITEPEIRLADSPAADAFGRLRVSNLTTLFDIKHLFDLRNVLMENLLATGATVTHDVDKATAVIAVTSTIGSRAVRQSRLYVPYQPGKSRLALMTGILQLVETTGIRSRIGTFDDDGDKDTPTFPGGGNGHFFELDIDGTLYVVERSFVTGSQIDTKIAQASWNLDAMDGSGPSSVTLDTSKAQIFVIDQEWLGAGRVRIGFYIGGRLIYCHQFLHANLEVSAYTSTASLPVRYELENVSAVAGATMHHICSSVQSEGGFTPRGPIFADDITTGVGVGATEVPLISFRAKAVANRITLNPIRVSVAAVSVGQVEPIVIRVRIRAALTGATFASSDPDSNVEVDKAATAVSGGSILSGAMLTEENFQTITEFVNTLLGNATIAGIPDIITVTGEKVTGTAVDVVAAVQWQEWI